METTVLMLCYVYIRVYSGGRHNGMEWNGSRSRWLGLKVQSIEEAFCDLVVITWRTALLSRLTGLSPRRFCAVYSVHRTIPETPR